MTAQASFPLEIRILRRFNPLIMSILRSRLHGMMSRELLVLEYCGHKTGKAHSIPLGYVTLAEHRYCVTRGFAAWSKNFALGSEVAVWVRGQRLAAHAERLPSTSPEAHAAFVLFLRANPQTARRLYNVRVDARGEPDASDVAREIHNSAVVRIAYEPRKNSSTVSPIVSA